MSLARTLGHPCCGVACRFALLLVNTTGHRVGSPTTELGRSGRQNTSVAQRPVPRRHFRVDRIRRVRNTFEIRPPGAVRKAMHLKYDKAFVNTVKTRRPAVLDIRLKYDLQAWLAMRYV